MVPQPELKKKLNEQYCGRHFCKYTKISLVLFEGYIVLYGIFSQFPIEHLDWLQFFAIIIKASMNYSLQKYLCTPVCSLA